MASISRGRDFVISTEKWVSIVGEKTVFGEKGDHEYAAQVE